MDKNICVLIKCLVVAVIAIVVENNVKNSKGKNIHESN